MKKLPIRIDSHNPWKYEDKPDSASVLIIILMLAPVIGIFTENIYLFCSMPFVLIAVYLIAYWQGKKFEKGVLAYAKKHEKDYK
ncbi:MAG: hypothetical protein KAS32_24745 [Candidatus Peribacteraceae bacterium]|nr:hypothetical protein [Candidatus Peribacteraceae bacterium]